MHLSRCRQVRQRRTIVESSLGWLLPAIFALAARAAGTPNHPIHQDWGAGLVSTRRGQRTSARQVGSETSLINSPINIWHSSSALVNQPPANRWLMSAVIIISDKDESCWCKTVSKVASCYKPHINIDAGEGNRIMVEKHHNPSNYSILAFCKFWISLLSASKSMKKH